MPREPIVTMLSKLSEASFGVFRAESATGLGVTRNQLARLSQQGVIERVLPHTYRMASVAPSARQRLQAALLWAGDQAAAAGRSAAELYRLEGVRATIPEIVLPYRVRGRTSYATVYHGEVAALMLRTVHGVRTTGVEATLTRLAHVLDGRVARDRVRGRAAAAFDVGVRVARVPRSVQPPGTPRRRVDAAAHRRARPSPPCALDARGQDPTAPRGAGPFRLRA